MAAVAKRKWISPEVRRFGTFEANPRVRQDPRGKRRFHVPGPGDRLRFGIVADLEFSICPPRSPLRR
jgi:hypothetical protein